MKKILYKIFPLVLMCCLPLFSSVQAQELKGKPPVKIYHEKGAVYTIEYPHDWVYEKAGSIAVVFSGPSGTKAYYSTVSIQNLLSKMVSGGRYQNLDALISDILGQLSKAKGFRRSNIEPFDYSKGSIKLTGKQFVAEYQRDGESFRQWCIMIQRPKGDAFHTWFYTSPVTQYDEFSGIAKTMLDSWTITK